jgi:hypothetical protein
MRKIAWGAVAVVAVALGVGCASEGDAPPAEAGGTGGAGGVAGTGGLAGADGGVAMGGAGAIIGAGGIAGTGGTSSTGGTGGTSTGGGGAGGTGGVPEGGVGGAGGNASPDADADVSAGGGGAGGTGGSEGGGPDGGSDVIDGDAKGGILEAGPDGADGPDADFDGAVCVAPDYTPPATCTPAWVGTMMVACETAERWTVETDAGASASLNVVPGTDGNALELNWNMGTGLWVQARYDAVPTIDLSQVDIFGISLKGGAASDQPVQVTLMFKDVNGIVVGTDIAISGQGINQIPRWLNNLAFPRSLFRYFWGSADGGTVAIEWSQIKSFFVVAKRDADKPSGTGRLAFDSIRSDRAADWPRPAALATASVDRCQKDRAVAYVIGQQQATGFINSWKEEPSPKAWLYDQAVALIALSRAGQWQGDAAVDDSAGAAKKLAEALVGKQKNDGHWVRAWDPITGDELPNVDDRWIGDQAWTVVGLEQYARASGAATAEAAAQKGADYVAGRIRSDGSIARPDGFLEPSTEGTVDVWWAMTATGRTAEANKVRDRLLSDEVWDSRLKYFRRGEGDPVVALDAATWLSLFAHHPAVNVPERGRAALGFVRHALVTSAGQLCGMDGMGPVSLWFEGIGGYVVAGGPDAQGFLNLLAVQQRPDGALPGSPEAIASNAFGWLTPWSGLAATSWFIFAATQSPFSGL